MSSLAPDPADFKKTTAQVCRICKSTVTPIHVVRCPQCGHQDFSDIVTLYVGAEDALTILSRERKKVQGQGLPRLVLLATDETQPRALRDELFKALRALGVVQ